MGSVMGVFYNMDNFPRHLVACCCIYKIPTTSDIAYVQTKNVVSGDVTLPNNFVSGESNSDVTPHFLE